jgi:hypothetical protein
MPKDPMTGRADTWELQLSADPTTPGVVDIHTGSSSHDKQGSAYREW